MNNPAVEVRQLALQFSGPSRRIDVLAGADLTVASGERIAVMGKSGSGKSSLLNCLGGLLTPTSGTVKVDGQPIDGSDEERLATYRLNTVGIVYQNFNLLGALSAVDNVALPIRLKGVGKVQAREAAADLLESVGLGDRIRHRPRQLSGGEQQRVGIARAIANDPVLLLADEPTGNLDEDTSHQVLDVLCAAGGRPRTVIVVTHDPDVAKTFDRILYLRSGLIVEDPIP